MRIIATAAAAAAHDPLRQSHGSCTSFLVAEFAHALFCRASHGQVSDGVFSSPLPPPPPPCSPCPLGRATPARHPARRRRHQATQPLLLRCFRSRALPPRLCCPALWPTLRPPPQHFPLKLMIDAPSIAVVNLRREALPALPGAFPASTATFSTWKMQWAAALTGRRRT